jgi:hypothetical protein
MKKISYRSRPRKELILTKNLPTIEIVDDTTTENVGRFGYIMPGDLYPVSSGNPSEPDKNKLSLILKNLKKQNLDKKESNFVDFLIKKTSQSNNISYEKLFVKYIYKIYMSDMINSNEKIKNITSKYSSLVKDNFDAGLTILASKELAYKKIINDSQILKEAQIRESDPKFVAEHIARIIMIMISKFSMESRNKARANVRRRIANLNIQEVSSKKTPAGAAIGTSIALVKNILNGKDGYFIKTVIDEIQKYI